MHNPLHDIFLFLDTGGSVVTVLLFASLIFWTLIIEKYLSYRYIFRAKSKKLKSYWKKHPQEHWVNTQLKQAQVSDLALLLHHNTTVMRSLIALFPLIGLLGTVTGMITVFDSMSTLGANAKAMAAGISMATLPTMVGMFLAVFGIFAYSRIDFIINQNITLLKERLLKENDA